MKLTIATKMSLFATVSVVLIIIVSTAGIYIASSMKAILDDTFKDRVPELTDASELQMLMLQAEDWAADAVRERDVELGAKASALRPEAQRLVAALQRHELETEEEAALYDSLAQEIPIAFDLLDAYLAAALTNPDSADTEETGEKLETHLEETLKPLTDQVTTGRLEEIEELKEEGKALVVRFSILRTALIVLSLAAVVVGALAALGLARPIARAATHLSAVAESISRGDLDVPIEVKTGDEMQVLAESFERMRASLKAAIERLRARRETA